MSRLAKITAIILIAAALFSTVSFTSQVVSDFKIGFMVDKVFLKWKSQLEDTVGEYVIERSFDNILYNSIGKMNPKGDFSEYMFIDKNIFKSSTRTFYYRLKVQKKDGTFTHTDILQLTPRVSSAKQTWGSIKAIFH